ncbi:MAG TPA: c-type cytochrome [Usitatibacter sp.]|nr:c-type cytochrome [Usitatibacter sp.]
MRAAARALAGLVAAAGASAALAQQPAPPPPSFAPPNLTQRGVAGLAAACAACHGTQGRASEGSAVPGLAGRPSAEVVAAMGEFRAGTRPATIMHQIAKGYSDAEVAAIAEYFARQR